MHFHSITNDSPSELKNVYCSIIHGKEGCTIIHDEIYHGPIVYASDRFNYYLANRFGEINQGSIDSINNTLSIKLYY